MMLSSTLSLIQSFLFSVHRGLSFSSKACFFFLMEKLKAFSPLSKMNTKAFPEDLVFPILSLPQHNPLICFRWVSQTSEQHFFFHLALSLLCLKSRFSEVNASHKRDSCAAPHVPPIAGCVACENNEGLNLPQAVAHLCFVTHNLWIIILRRFQPHTLSICLY